MGDLTLNISNPHRSTCIFCSYDEENWFYNQELFCLVNHLLASISICFGAKKDRGTGFSVLAKQEMKQDPKNEREGRGRKPFFPHSFTHTIFHSVRDSHSLFFTLKPHGNACYAG